MATRKNVKILILFACGIALVLASSSCKKDSDQPPEQPPRESPVSTTTDLVVAPPVSDQTLQVVPLVGLGSVRFGMTKEQVIENLGQPERSEADIGLYYLTSIGIDLRLAYRGGVREINCWSNQYPMAPEDMKTFAGKTKTGIAMGAGREQVVAAYGQPDSTTVKGPIETLHYGKLQAQFALMQGKLVHIKITASK